MAELKGINLAMQTPFDDTGAVDYGRWEELIDIYIDAGVHGLVLGAGTGQHPYLTEEECNKLYETGIRRIDGRCHSICQTSALNVNEVIRRSKHSEGAGADALMILPPYLEGPADDEGLFEFYADIDREISIDIVGYNIPQTTGLSVSVPLYKRLNTLEHFNYIKDSAVTCRSTRHSFRPVVRSSMDAIPPRCLPSWPGQLVQFGAVLTICLAKRFDSMNWWLRGIIRLRWNSGRA